ncbi:MAG: outer membrane beta-barrel protein [Bacteroidales bacterium]|nr:outer membrane beta-barrel protein [Bacteroidales bacterium]
MKSICLLMALFLSLSLEAQNNKWRVYPSLGVDMGGATPFPFSDIPDGAKGTPKINPNLGFGFSHQLYNRWSLSLEVSYHLLAFSARADVRSQPFYFDNHLDILYFSGNTSTDVELRFLEFPVLAEYSLNARWSLALGAYYSRILEGSFRTSGTNGVLSDDKSITDTAPLPGVANTSYNFNNYLDAWDGGLLLGFWYGIHQKLHFWSRLQVGFKSIFVPEFENIDYEMYQVRFSTGVSIALFSNRNEQP